MNNKVFLASGTFLVVVIISFMQGAMAAGFELEVFPDKVSLCPCSAITPQHVSVTLKNLKGYTDSYTLALAPPAGWSYKIQGDITLGSGEEGSLDLFLINTGCTVPAGTYYATVTAKSVTTGEKVSETLEIEVLLCRGAELSVAEERKEVCFEEPVPVTYEMEIKNLGKFRETFELSSATSWASFPEDEITAESGETKPFNVILDPASLPVNLHTVLVYARSTDPNSPLHYTPVSEALELDVKDCYDFTADLQPKENTVCFGKAIDYALMIENTGLNGDSYLIYTPDWVTGEETEVSLEPGEKANVKVTAEPETLGKVDISVTVSSSSEPGLSKKASSIVVSEECRGVAVIVSPAEHTVCGGMPPVSFDVSVKNTGMVRGEYQLTASLGTPQSGSMTLNPGETGTTKLDVDLTGLMGEVVISLEASDSVISDEAGIVLTVENCYSAGINITPDMQAVCPYDAVSYTITLENTGELPDSYTIRYGDETQGLDLEPGESQGFELSFLVPFEEAGVYVVSAFADSNHVSVAETVALNVRTMEECYGAELQAEEKSRIKLCTIEECETTTLPVEIKNTGEKPASYALSLEGPEWVYMEPTSFDLEPGESGIAYLYLSPGFDVDEDTYTVSIKAESEYTELKKVVDIAVMENVTAGEPGVSLNASAGGITGAIIGGERPLWKTVLVAVIALIIIIILAVRFILLVKK